MAKYQIEYKDGTSRSYSYFDAEKDIEKSACEKANKVLDRDKGMHETSFAGRVGIPFKPQKTLTVREMDMEKKQPKRGGHKFKLHLHYLEMTFQSGRKNRDEWYQFNG